MNSESQHESRGGGSLLDDYQEENLFLDAEKAREAKERARENSMREWRSRSPVSKERVGDREENAEWRSRSPVSEERSREELREGLREGLTPRERVAARERP